MPRSTCPSSSTADARDGRLVHSVLLRQCRLRFGRSTDSSYVGLSEPGLSMMFARRSCPVSEHVLLISSRRGPAQMTRVPTNRSPARVGDFVSLCRCRPMSQLTDHSMDTTFSAFPDDRAVPLTGWSVDAVVGVGGQHHLDKCHDRSIGCLGMTTKRVSVLPHPLVVHVAQRACPGRVRADRAFATREGVCHA